MAYHLYMRVTTTTFKEHQPALSTSSHTPMARGMLLFRLVQVRQKTVYLQYSTRQEIGSFGAPGGGGGGGDHSASPVILIIMDNIHVSVRTGGLHPTSCRIGACTGWCSYGPISRAGSSLAGTLYLYYWQQAA
jgi:hypothetical protein